MQALRVIALSTVAASLLLCDGVKLPQLKDLDVREIKLGEDEPGCKDSTLLPRLAGCSIIQCGSRESDSIELQVGATADGIAQNELADGASEIIYYLYPGKLSPSSIVKQGEQGLIKTGGFKLVFSGKDNDEMPVLTVRKDDQFVQLSTYTYNTYSAYVFTAVRLDPEPPVTAEAMADELRGRGHFLLTGFSFDGDETQLSGEAEKILGELASALKSNPDLKVRVETHTDNLEGPQTSQQLSDKRAAAIVDWLATHGVEKDRLAAQGHGSAKPVADNESDEGRTRNRRIEVTRQI